MRITNHEQFVQKLHLIRNDVTLLSYYTNNKIKLLIKDHLGIQYLMRPDALLKNTPLNIKSAVNKNLAFKSKLFNKFPNLTLISEFKNFKQELIVRDEFGIFYKSMPYNLLTYKVSVKTAIDKTLYFKVTASIIHGNKYNYSKSIYINQLEKLIINCPEHGDFLQAPHCHLINRRGCNKCGIENHPGPMCSVAKYNPNKETFLYLFKCHNEKEQFYKLGMSVNPKIRASNIPYNIEILGITKGNTNYLFKIEQQYHKKFKEINIKYIPKIKFPGYSECFC